MPTTRAGGTVRIAIHCTKENLAVKAAYAFLDACGIEDFDISIEIKKNIPVSAGLAGGSTDAAAVIRLLNEAFETSLPDEKMSEIGASVGSDVPFCIKGGTAFVTGRGEKLCTLEQTPELVLVVAKGGVGVSTPAAYRMIDEKFKDGLNEDFGNIDGMLSAIKEQNSCDFLKNLYNTFEEVVLPDHPTAGKIKEYMLSNGALGPLLSGSGPSVFGVFESTEEAQSVSEYFNSLGYSSFVCRTVSSR